VVALNAEFLVVTPLFMGQDSLKGVIQAAEVIRPPSVKGALRLWWRAMEWKHCLNENLGQVEAALRAMHEKECALWGVATSGLDQGGQGRFLLTVKEVESNWEYNQPSLSQQYLLGQGLWDAPRQGQPGHLLRRSCKTSRFRVEIVFRPRTTPKDIESVARSLLVWGLLGGLGSRSRKGFGSVAIQSLDCPNGQSSVFQVPQSMYALSTTLTALLAPLTHGLPPFTAFSDATRIDGSLSGTSAMSLLDKAGDEMQFYRSNGRGGLVRGQEAEPTFRSDHEVVQNVAFGNHVTTAPRRVVFGLPHNYFFSSTDSKVDIPGQGATWERRASPLFIHIHQFPTGKCALIQSLLPAEFLPDGVQVRMKPDRARIQNVNPGVDWSVITDYLDRFATKYPSKGFQKIIG